MTMRALCSAILLCWTTLRVAGAAGPSPHDAPPTLRAGMVADAGTFVAPVALRHLAAASTPSWRTPWPVVLAADAATLRPARTGAREITPRATSRAPVGPRSLRGYDAAAPPPATA